MLRGGAVQLSCVVCGGVWVVFGWCGKWNAEGLKECVAYGTRRMVLCDAVQGKVDAEGLGFRV